MVNEARGFDPVGTYVRGDATALPFVERSFDRITAMAVLYHVANWPLALREVRRVVRPGGRVVISTNGPDAMQALHEVHREAAIELGFAPLPFTGSHFHLGHLAEVREVFPGAECHVINSELVFRAAEPAVRFYVTNRVDLIEHPPPDGSHRSRLAHAVGERIQQVIDRDGAFRVPKSYGFFVAET
jgi:SAM-dependent methyltransferase